MKIIEFLTIHLYNKKFRIFISLFAIINGIARLDLLDILKITQISFGTGTFFGLSLVIFGTSLFVSTLIFDKNLWLKGIVCTLGAALYSALGVAVYAVSPISAIGTWLISIFLILESSVVHDC